MWRERLEFGKDLGSWDGHSAAVKWKSRSKEKRKREGEKAGGGERGFSFLARRKPCLKDFLRAMKVPLSLRS